MRVGFLIDRWRPGRGGAEGATADLARWLGDRGHDVHVFAVESDERGSLHRVRVPFALTRGARERALGEALVAAAASERCDVTVGVRHLPRVDLYWPHGGSHAAALRGLRSARAGRWFADGEVRAGGRHRAFLDLEWALLDGGTARRVACVSRLVLRELSLAYPAATSRLALVPDGVDTERFHPRERDLAGRRLRERLGIDARTPLLTFTARNPVLKGLPALLEALSGIDDRPWHVLIAGAKHPALWERRARGAGIPHGRATVLADVDPVASAAASDLAVLPSWRDTCGLVLLEALACGTPVVTTSRAGAAELVTSEDVGSVLDDPADVPALRSAIASRLDRARRDGRDHSAARDAVRGRDRATWLAGLEAILLDLAARPSL